MNENQIELVTKLADYEAEIDILTDLILENVNNTEKVSQYKKDLIKLKSLHTRTKNVLEKSLV